MQAMYETVLAVHVVAALLSVVTFWIPAFAGKGSTLHVRAGQLYVRAIIVMSATALVLCAMNLADPVGAGSTEQLRARRALLGTDSSRDSVEFLVHGVRMNATWLAYLSVLLLAGVRFGTRVITTRHDHRALGNALEVGLCGALVVSGPAMLVFGILNSHVLVASFGAIGLLDGSTRLAYLSRTPKTRMEWWYTHMGVMLGTGVPLHIALLLAVGRHLPGPPGAWRLLPSTLVIIGIPAIAMWKRYYRNRFEPRRHVKIETALEAVQASRTV